MPDTILYMLRGLTFSGKTTLDKTLEYPQQDERAFPFQPDDLDLRAPGGESGREVQNRGWAALKGLLASDAQLPVAVSHGNLISLLFHSLDADFGYQQWEALSNPDVFLLQETERDSLQFERIWL